MQLTHLNSNTKNDLIRYYFEHQRKFKNLLKAFFELKQEVKNFELYKFHIAQIRHVENMYRGGFLGRHQFLLKKTEAVITPDNPTNRQFLKEIERIMIELGCIHTRNRGRWFSLVTLGEAIRRLEQYQESKKNE